MKKLTKFKILVTLLNINVQKIFFKVLNKVLCQYKVLIILEDNRVL